MERSFLNATRPLPKTFDEIFIDTTALRDNAASFISVEVSGKQREIELSDIAYIRPLETTGKPDADPFAVIVLPRAPHSLQCSQITTQTPISEIADSAKFIALYDNLVPLCSIESVIGDPSLNQNSHRPLERQLARQERKSYVKAGGHQIPSPDSLYVLAAIINNIIAGNEDCESTLDFDL